MSKTANFPYTNANFNGTEFLKNRDNFALKSHIKSIKIFEMMDFSAESSVDSANLSQNAESANRGGAE